MLDSKRPVERSVLKQGEFRDPDRYGSVSCLSTSGFHSIAYTEWGPQDAEEVVVCVHGLTRQGRDFDVLASRLAEAGYRVVCPDLVGRGQSDWLPSAIEYVFPQHCADMACLLAKLGGKRVHWIGTSFGGLIGIVLASILRSPISSLVVNDIGPEVPTQAAGRVAMRLLSEPTSFSSMDEVEEHMRKIYVACGPLTDDQWRHIAFHSVRLKNSSQFFVPLMDPKIATTYWLFWFYSMSLWKYWNDLRIPVLAIHGERSDFLPKTLVANMKRSMPALRTVEVANTGHMPMLMSESEVNSILSFLKSNK